MRFVYNLLRSSLIRYIYKLIHQKRRLYLKKYDNYYYLITLGKNLYYREKQ